MPNTNTTAVGSPPLQRSRALSNGREQPTSARNMSAPSAAAYDGRSSDDSARANEKHLQSHPYMLKVKATPPATPPRINTPNVATSPAYTSPNPQSKTSSAAAASKPSMLTSLKVHFKPTPPATPPRITNAHAHNLLAASSPCVGTPNVVSPLLVPPSSAKALSASTPNDAAPKIVENIPSRACMQVESPGLGSPLLTRRAHALAASSRTSDVVCTPPRDMRRLAEKEAAMSPRIVVVQSTSEVPAPSPSKSIISLKSSVGISMVKSPRAKDYLLEKLASKPAVPLTRSKSPPPRTYESPACDSPKIRKLSEPVPFQYDHLRRDILKGSCDGISMPYNVTHTTHVDSHSLKMSEGCTPIVFNNTVPVVEKSGFLQKLAGSSFKERWVECKRSTLSYYAKKDAAKPRREIHLTDCEFMRDKTSKRPFTLHLIHTPTKKNYYFAAPDAESFEEWVRVFHSSGATDKDFVVAEKDQKQKEEKQEAARKARETKKQEDDYVREKLKRKSTLKIINKNMSDCSMEACLCTLAVQDVVEKDSGQEFKINVTFDDQTWTIYRNFDKVAKMYDAMTKLKFVKGMCPPRKCPSSMKEAEFIQLQISKLQGLLDLLARNRPCVLASATPKQRFLRFIAPVGWDDAKPAKFVMPFQFDF